MDNIALEGWSKDGEKTGQDSKTAISAAKKKVKKPAQAQKVKVEVVYKNRTSQNQREHSVPNPRRTEPGGWNKPQDVSSQTRKKGVSHSQSLNKVNMEMG